MVSGPWLLMGAGHRHELKWIRGNCERVANSGVFGYESQVYDIGHMRMSLSKLSVSNVRASYVS